MQRELLLAEQIEGVLFYKAAPVKKTALAKLFAVKEADIEAALAELATRLSTTGLRLVATDTTATLATAPELDVTIESLRKEELRRDIGKAGAETLAIVLYRGPVSRAEIDRIRGVNSAYILRSLLTRGLIERRGTAARPQFAGTPELLRHLGVTDAQSLPGYAETIDALEAYEKQVSATEST
jgi:segregation and condensation protein B